VEEEVSEYNCVHSSVLLFCISRYSRICASSKRKLDAYRARPLEPKEGELANENNEMFEKVLQSKLPQNLIDKTDESQTSMDKIRLIQELRLPNAGTRKAWAGHVRIRTFVTH
jgi:hypothetical protein